MLTSSLEISHPSPKQAEWEQKGEMERQVEDDSVKTEHEGCRH